MTVFKTVSRCFPMKTAAEYRVMADKCFKWARNTYMDEARETYLQLAQFWLDVASKLDGPRGSKPGRPIRSQVAQQR